MRVLDGRGNTIAGAEVSHAHGGATTDAAGAATVRLRPDHWDPRYWGDGWKTVRVRADGFADVRRRWHFGGRPMVFRLYEPALVVRGRCVDTWGEGVPGLDLAIGRVRVATDANGRFETRASPLRELELEVRSRDWISAPRRVTAPANDLTVLVHRAAHVQARLCGDGRPDLPEFEVQDGEGVSRSGDTYHFRCVPGPVRIAWRGHELARLDLGEGEVKRDVELRLPDGLEDAPRKSWVDVDFSRLPAQPGGEAWGWWESGGWVRLGALGPTNVTRLALPAPGLERLRVRAHTVGVWEQPARDETRVLLRAPPRASIRVGLRDAAGHPVRDGRVAARADGSGDLVARGGNLRAILDASPPAPPLPEAMPPPPDRFLLCGLGPGTYDLLFLPAGSEVEVPVLTGLVVGADGATRDLGILPLPSRIR